jgi:hypothetical protein
MSNNSSIRRLAGGTATIKDTEAVWEAMQSAVNHWKIEFATLVEVQTASIIANGNSNRSSEYFNPSNLIDVVSNYNERVICTVVMDYEEFEKEHTPRFL